MDSLVITGKFLGAMKPETIGNNGFTVRRFYLDTTTNPDFPNTPEFQLKGDKINLVDNLVKGQTIQVKFNVDGRKYKNQQTGKEGVITNLNAWKIDVLQMQSAAVAQPRQPVVAAAPPTTTPQPFPFAGDDSEDLPF